MIFLEDDTENGDKDEEEDGGDDEDEDRHEIWHTLYTGRSFC